MSSRTKIEPIRIDFKTNAHKLFTPLFYKLREARTRFVVNYGGSGSGKSVSQHQHELIKLMEGRYNTLIVRKHASDIQDSCYSLFESLISKWGLSHLFSSVYSNAKREITYLPKGNKILFKGIDDPEKLKSIVGIQRIMIEEASQITEKDFREINRRARGLNGIQITVLFNPVDEQHWLKKYFFDKPAVREKTAVFHSTYKENRFLKRTDREELEALAEINPNEYRIYALGEWGKAEVKRPYLYNFEHGRHVSAEAAYNPAHPIRLSFDFNVSPFVCILGQIWTDNSGQHVRIFKEIALHNGDIYKMVEAIKSAIPASALPHIKVTGDAMQRKREITQRENIDAWRMIQSLLKVSDARLEVPRANPSVANNRFLVNAILAQHKSFRIHPDCATLINDCQYVETDEQGNIIKDNRKDVKKRADALDCLRYFCNTWLHDFVGKPLR